MVTRDALTYWCYETRVRKFHDLVAKVKYAGFEDCIVPGCLQDWTGSVIICHDVV